MGAPINVKLESPTMDIPGWDGQSAKWVRLNEASHGNPAFYPLTVKFGYVFGIIYELCDCAERLVHRQKFGAPSGDMPAFTLVAAGIELLGRCVAGTKNPRKSTLIEGLDWLHTRCLRAYSDIHVEACLVTTTTRSYSIDDLCQLRHYAAHGQGTSRLIANEGLTSVDREVLPKLVPLLRDGLEHYWARLRDMDEPCNNLAQANVATLQDWPVYHTWRHLQEKDAEGNTQSITSLFGRLQHLCPTR